MPTTLVLIPGLLSDARVWRPLETAIPGLDIHRADVTKDNTIQGMAARILNAVEGDCVIVGHSMGGRVAMEVAHQAPGRVTALVLANTGHNPLQPGEREKRQAKIDHGHTDFKGMVKAWLPPMVAASRHGDADLIANLTEMALSIGPEIHERQITALINRPDAATYLPDLTCPILLMTGTEDLWSPAAQHQEMQKMAPNATLQIVESAGHFLPVEQPGAATQRIADWLKSTT